MGILLGPFDPLQLNFNILNELMRKGYVTPDEARKILKNSMDPNMKEKEKDKILDSMIKKVD